MTARRPATPEDWPLPGPPHVLREYALLADGERGALVDPQGEITWLCAPHWDSDAVFCSLLGGAGGYLVSPVHRYVWGGSYEPGSLVWRSRWVTESGIVECHEALAFPGDPHRVVILRRIHARHAPARMDVVLEPAAGFGRRPLEDLRRDEGGGWHGRAGALRMCWSGAPDARPRGDGRGLRA
ncbi:MAG: glycoside hydrolase family 15 protein, partial [Pseudonocardia sp.]|nr:glycoside hydrolase family 15 protein [Pseudonocardia sp.]